ncbi:MAG: response regulator, partial [Saprospiraceae bacterium]|nr:response regulator [Saprospiraceae bacterium]
MNPNAIKAVIVDDEVGSRNNLRLLLEEYCPEVEVCGMGHDVLSGLELVKKYRPRILFLDIEMPQHSGFKLVEMLDPQERPGIVFVTA